ncbi:hypothetical protein PMAYCL1PPCAC_21253, partial [Pristionchus mayeri]
FENGSNVFDEVADVPHEIRCVRRMGESCVFFGFLQEPNDGKEFRLHLFRYAKFIVSFKLFGLR